MDGCIHCQQYVPIDGGGTLIIATDSLKQAETWSALFQTNKIAHIMKKTHLHVEYDDVIDLQAITGLLNNHLDQAAKKRMRGNIVVEQNLPDFVHFPLYPYTEIEQRIQNPHFVNIIQNKLFTSHMQPIFNTRDEKVYGYEFLLRPTDTNYPFSPGQLFSFSQRSGMQSMLDSHARISAIRAGSKWLNNDEKIFINFLPSSIYDPAHCLKSTFEAAATYNIDPNRLVFEVVETEKITDIPHLKTIFNEYQKAGVKVALDDIGSGFATIGMLKKLMPDYVKIDRMLVQNCHENPDQLKQINEISRVAREQGTLLLAEGVETKEEYETVKPLVDFTQGYYFARPQAEPYAG